MAPQYPVEENVAYLADPSRAGDVHTIATAHSQTPWPAQRRHGVRKPIRRENSGYDGCALPTEFRDPLWLCQIRQWDQSVVIEHANNQLRQGLLELGLDLDHAGALVRQFAEAAEQWLFIGHGGEARTRCRQELHSTVGKVLGRAVSASQLEKACQLLSKAWLLLQIWDGSTARLPGTYQAIQQEIRLCLAYSIVKESVRDSAAHLMLYISACSPQSPFFAELATRLENVAEDTAEVVEVYKQYFFSVLGVRDSATVVH